MGLDSVKELLTMQDLIDYTQRQIIVHSYIYYELNNNAISDREYDALCKKLVALRNEHPDLWRTSEYYKQFGDDYNGATGFTLYHDLDEHQKEIIRSIVSYAPIAKQTRYLMKRSLDNSLDSSFV